MKYKNILFFSIFILFIVGISCVSAQNIDEIGNSSSDDTISLDDDISTINIVDNEISTNVDGEVICDGKSTRDTYSWADFKSEVENTNINTIELNKGNIAPSSDSSNQISINHDINIIGGYGYYIGGDSWSSSTKYNYIPIITSGSNLNVKFENVTFQYLSDNVFMKLMGNGNYTFKNCVFSNINATGSHQSVIWLNYGHALIENCSFIKCNCSFGAVTNYYSSWGTAVNNARMTVRDSTFKDNYATTEPGAINNCGQLVVYDSTFENNEAVWWAGAIHTHSNANTTIIRSKFKNNYAGWNGGALYTYSYLTVINSTFTANTAKTNTGGGAIGASSYMSTPKVVIKNSEFKYNTALTGNGGAIVISSGTLNVESSEFTNNTALELNGGAISSSSCTAAISNCKFINNTLNKTAGKGGAVYGTGKGRLTVDKCEFINNAAKDNNSGHALAYYYNGNSNTAAYLTYTNNIFFGKDNGTGSVFVANDKVNIVQYNNSIDDITNYIEPENNTNSTSSGNITIPIGTEILSSSWDVILGDNLNGTPVIAGNYILIPASHDLYCYNYITQDLVWNFTTEFGYFHELLVDGNIVYAPASWDALYIFNLTNGESLTYSNIYQGSSLYKPVIYNNTLYVSSEYGYGINSNNWISMIKHDSDYYYYGSILELNNVSYGTPAILSQPYIHGNTLYVNTIQGLIAYNLVDGTSHNISGTVGNPIIDANGNICILSNNGAAISLLNSNLEVVASTTLDGTCNKLISDANGNIYTVDNNGYIYYATYTSSSITCSKTKFNINPVSSAMACYNGELYIGDNNGILWAFNTNALNQSLTKSLNWAFDAGSAIVGNIAVDNYGTIYIGTDNRHFYAIEH
ncbi:PQQ-binding-like beta-propeller repeat protein [Methanobrevibacter gottschalkii]|uniref:hypothetical protein n=1 Tax=Methanobrevibacter gottschalkii TaxID=190974 RepID=UPI0038D1F5E8